MKRWVAAVALALLSVLGMPALAAQADETACADTYYSTSGRELFSLDTRLTPPPLRGFAWDCASKLAAEEFDVSGATSFGYDLIWVGLTWDDFVAVVRAFEDSEWASPGLITNYDLAGGGTRPLDTDTDLPLDAGELAAMPPLEFAGARFSNEATRQDIVTISYTDGVLYDNAAEWDEPSLVVSVITDHTYDSTGILDPSTLSTLRTIFAAAPSPQQWAVIGTGSVILTIVIGWPSVLLNGVVSTRYQALVHRLTARRRAGKKAGADAVSATIRRSGLPGWLMWPGFALAAILGAFVDPDFGLNLMSARLVLTLFLSFVLFNLATWALVSRVARRLQPDSDPYLRFRWGSLALVVIAVVVARLLSLEPGIIFGLVAGIAYAATLQAARSAIITIVGSAFGFALALAAWVGYSLLAPLDTDNPALIFLVEFLAGVTVKGVSSLPLSLLPLGNLDGAKLFGWRRLIWGVCYVVGLAAFMLVLLTIPKAWGEIPGDFLRWTLLFGGYAVVAVAIWAINAWSLARRPLPPEKEQGDQPDAITID